MIQTQFLLQNSVQYQSTYQKMATLLPVSDERVHVENGGKQCHSNN